MKRALAMALGAMMVAGSAAPASAASQIDFSGYYRVVYANEVNAGKYSEDGGVGTDSYFVHRLNIDMVFRATDEISVYWRLRGPNWARWGNSTGDNTLFTRFVYGQIDQDWGTLRIGRISDGFDWYGLGSLGYKPSTDPMWTARGAFDRGALIDGIRYNNKWDNGFGLTAQYQKVSNNDIANKAADTDSDQDIDRFIVEPTYEWDGGGVALGLVYERDAKINDGISTMEAQDAWFINPAIMHSWGDFSVHFEGMVGFASQGSKVNGGNDVDSDGYGFYLDADYNYGPGNVTLAGWWVSGTDMEDEDSGSLVDITQGANAAFYPLLVAYNASGFGWDRDYNNASRGANNAVGIANTGLNFVDGGSFATVAAADAGINATLVSVAGVAPTTNFFARNGNKGDSNHWALALTGNHAFTDDISMHYGLAYLALNESNYIVTESFNTADPDGTQRVHEQDKDLGFEADLSFSFKLLDNLSFVTSFGYMMNGDAYKNLWGYTAPDASGDVRAIWEDADDTYVWYNTLTFAF